MTDPTPPTPMLIDAPDDVPLATVLLAHGAGAAMDSAAMTALSRALARAGLRCLRFEFAYMAARREGGSRRPPPKAEKLVPEYLEAVAALGDDPATRPLLIGGKSMGGRVASLVADGLRDAGRIDGLLCIGYPFHPPKRPEVPRTAHLADLGTPTLICQGTRDPFGTEAEVAGYALSPAIETLWLPDGDHDLKPRKRLTGLTHAQHLDRAAEAAAGFARRLAAY